MNRSKGVILYRNVLELLKEAQYIEEDFAIFLQQALDDYIYNKGKLNHSLESLFRFNKHLVAEDCCVFYKEKEL
jgi:hypothetical protein